MLQDYMANLESTTTTRRGRRKAHNTASRTKDAHTGSGENDQAPVAAPQHWDVAEPRRLINRQSRAPTVGTRHATVAQSLVLPPGGAVVSVTRCDSGPSEWKHQGRSGGGGVSNRNVSITTSSSNTAQKLVLDRHSGASGVEAAALFGDMLQPFHQADVINAITAQSKRDPDAQPPSFRTVEEAAQRPPATMLATLLRHLVPDADQDPTVLLRLAASEAAANKAARPDTAEDLHIVIGRLLHTVPAAVQSQLHAFGVSTSHSRERMHRREAMLEHDQDHEIRSMFAPADFGCAISDNVGRGKFPRKETTTVAIRKTPAAEMGPITRRPGVVDASKVSLRVCPRCVTQMQQRGMANLVSVLTVIDTQLEALAGTDTSMSKCPKCLVHICRCCGAVAHEGACDDTPVPIPNSGIESLTTTNWSAKHQEFFGKQSIRDLMEPSDMVPQDEHWHKTIVRLLVHFDSALAHYGVHGYGIPPGDLPTARRVRRRSRVSRIQEDEEDAMLNTGDDPPFNKLEVNCLKCLKQLDEVYAESASLEKVEQKCIELLEIDPNFTRDILMSFGDGAPVRTRTNADGSPVDPHVMWIMGLWHKRNNLILNLNMVDRAGTTDSHFRQAGACTTAGRLAFAAEVGHVRRTLELLVAKLHGTIFEAVAAFCSRHVANFGQRAGGQASDASDESDSDYVMDADEAYERDELGESSSESGGEYAEMTEDHEEQSNVQADWQASGPALSAAASAERRARQQTRADAAAVVGAWEQPSAPQASSAVLSLVDAHCPPRTSNAKPSGGLRVCPRQDCTTNRVCHDRDKERQVSTPTVVDMVGGERGRGTITSTTGCIVRAHADMASAKIGVVPEGTVVEVLETTTVSDISSTMPWHGRSVRGRIAAPMAGWVTLSVGRRCLVLLQFETSECPTCHVRLCNTCGGEAHAGQPCLLRVDAFDCRRKHVAVHAIAALRFLLHEADVKDITGVLLLNIVLIDVAQVMEASWNLGSDLNAFELGQWAVLMSLPLDARKGADIYARLDSSQRAQFETASMRHQALQVHLSTATGETSYTANDFLMETLQKVLQENAKHVAIPDTLVSYQHTSVNMEEMIMEKKRMGRVRRSARKRTHGNAKPYHRGVHHASTRDWARRRRFFEEGDAVGDDGQPLQGLKGLRGDQLNPGFRTFMADGTQACC